MHLQLVLLHLAFSTANILMNHSILVSATRCCKGGVSLPTLTMCLVPFKLPDSVIGAHQSGALPLNTLANAILAKNDQMRQMAAMQYEEQARESVVRPRGIQ